jgi:hypothetical protein
MTRKQRINLALGLLSLLIATSFQNCSDVEFAKDSSSPDDPLKPFATPSLPPGKACPDGTYYATDGLCYELVAKSTSTTVKDVNRKIDIMLVIDGSGSMDPDRIKLGQKLGGFVNLLQGSGIDWQMCYTSTYISNSGSPYKWANDQYVINGTTANVDELFNTTMTKISIHSGGDEQGVASLNSSLSNSSAANCFREGVATTSIVISDEDERSCGGRCEKNSDLPTLSGRSLSSYTDQYRVIADINTPEALVAKIKNKFGNDHIYVAHALVIRSGDNVCYHEQDATHAAFFGKHYEELVRLTGGILGNICSTDYAKELANMATKIDVSLSAVTLACAPYGTVDVTITPKRAGQKYSVSGDKLTFTPALTTGDMVKADYQCLDKTSGGLPPIDI